MKTTKMVQVLCFGMGIIFSFSMAAYADSDTMAKDNTMMDKKTDQMKTGTSAMMPDDGMKGEAMQTKPTLAPMMPTGGMADGDSMKDKKVDPKAMEKDGTAEPRDGMKSGAMQDASSSDSMMKSDGK